jgi:hypothetical protein
MQLMKIVEVLRRPFPVLAYRILQMANTTMRMDEQFTNVFWQLVRDGRTILTIREAYNLYCYLTRSVALGGAVAELGVYKGGGSKLICEFKKELPFHLFDTFSGMPEVTENIDLHRAGDFSDTSLQSVQLYLQQYRNLHFHQGRFPESAKNIPRPTKYCFVHLDVDIYESTLAGLEYFYPRLLEGGIIISHDYNALSCPGVKRAFDEYFSKSKKEVRFLWDTQCMIRKSGHERHGRQKSAQGKKIIARKGK